jgi:hypothetical protein
VASKNTPIKILELRREQGKEVVITKQKKGGGTSQTDTKGQKKNGQVKKRKKKYNNNGEKKKIFGDGERKNFVRTGYRLKLSNHKAFINGHGGVHCFVIVISFFFSLIHKHSF